MSTLYTPLKINGVISTDKTALQNLNDICTAAGAFLTYDISQGKWAVIINKTESSIKSYTDANIIGSINVSETGVSELYNSVSMEFPHRNLRDQTDFVEVTIPVGDRYANEVPNTLNIQSTLINDPVQAQYLAGVELKQSRLNKIVTFYTDYTSLGLKAGDLIDLTVEMYGYTNKVFRVIKVEESDDDVIGVGITALEYSASVYSTDGLVAVEKTKKTGILLKQQNEELQTLDDAGVAGSIGRMIAANIGLGIANNLLNKLFGRRQIGTDANGNPIYDNKTKPANQSAEEMDKLLSNAKKPACETIESSHTSICAGGSFTVTIGHSCTSCLFNIPDFDYDYTITGVTEDDMSTALTGVITVSEGVGTLTVLSSSAASDGTITVTVGDLSVDVDLYAEKEYSYSVSKSASSITEGGSVTVTLTATGNKANATIAYDITGSASAKVSSPALTGTVTTVNGTATLVINTSDDSVYQGTQGLTVTFEPGFADPCGTAGTNSTSITVLDNDTAPPANVVCNYVSVPVVWCGTFSGSTGALLSITSRASAMLPVPAAGGATVMVPYVCSVSGGNVVVEEEIAVAAAATNVGGQAFRVITTFDTPTNKLITGSTVTLYGY